MAEGNNVVATLCSDGTVWPMDANASLGELANLVNYKIRTEGDMANKHKFNTTSVQTVVADLGKQLLLYAKDSDLIGVKTMLARGAPFTSDWLGMSALHFAALNNQYEICDVLLKAGMNKDIKSKVGRTPLHYAAYYGHERIAEMLLSQKCVVNPRDMLRMTPLHWAIERQHKSIVRMLIKYNADINVVTKFNKTPIGIAVLTEQPDILAELQAVKDEQAKKKFCEEQEKEISNAVEAILPETSESMDQTNLMDVEDYSCDTTANPHLANFDQIQDVGVLDNNTINLLKSHGILMMQDDEQDASKDMLATALKNGRQLVLSEGGKMLLNETRQNNQTKNQQTPATISTRNQLKDANISKSNNNSNNNNNNNNNSNKQNNNFAVPKTNQNATTTTENSTKNNVRIVSFKEFQNMFLNKDGKPVDKPTPLMSHMRIIRQQNDAAIATNLSNTANVQNNAKRNLIINSRLGHGQQQLQQQHRQMKITPMKTTTLTTVQSEQKPLNDAIKITSTDHENQISERLSMPPHSTALHTNVGGNNSVRSIASGASGSTNKINKAATVPLCVLPNTRRIPNAPPVVRQVNLVKVQQQQQQQQHIETTVPTTAGVSSSTLNKWNSGAHTKPIPQVMPLLSTPEICRQLHELRKQNEELRRRVDFLQKEKEDMRLRLDRFEELLLVERADEETYEIVS